MCLVISDAGYPVGAKGNFTLLVGPQNLANQFKDAIFGIAPVMLSITHILGGC